MFGLMRTQGFHMKPSEKQPRKMEEGELPGGPAGRCPGFSPDSSDSSDCPDSLKLLHKTNQSPKSMDNIGQKIVCKVTKVQGRIIREEKPYRFTQTWPTPKVISRLGNRRRFQQQLKHPFGCSRIFPTPPGFLAFPEILAFSTLESTNTTKPRTVLLGYAREIQPRVSRDDILTAPDVVFPVLVDILAILHPEIFKGGCPLLKHCKKLKGFASMTNLVDLLAEGSMP